MQSNMRFILKKAQKLPFFRVFTYFLHLKQAKYPKIYFNLMNIISLYMFNESINHKSKIYALHEIVLHVPYFNALWACGWTRIGNIAKLRQLSSTGGSSC